MARKPTPRATSKEPAGAPSPWRYAVPLAILWLLLFAAYYFTRRLPNNSQFDRLTIALLLPELSALTSDSGLPSGLRYLPQRFDLVATAAFIAAGVWGLGGLLFRVVRRCTPHGHDPLDRVERNALRFGLGVAAWSLLTLLFGLAGWLSRPLFAGVLGLAFVTEMLLFVVERRERSQKQPGWLEQPGSWLVIACLGAIAACVVLAALGAMLPPVDFDVKEYHLGGPKEWFQEGRIQFLPHNVYTSFPFLTEMLSLSAMVVRGDWYRGALAGQLLLAGFLPLTAMAVFATGRRLFGAKAGLIGALVYATTPWAYRISVIAYAEGGLSCFLALALLATVMAVQQSALSVRWTLLAGVFAGSAMACKYPGVVQAVLPIGIALLVAAIRNGGGAPAGSDAAGQPLTPDPSPQGEGDRRMNALPSDARGRLRAVLRTGIIYSLGVLLAVGPWLVKNAVETGNPVYPLLWSVFGGIDWDAELDMKWRAAHSPPHFAPQSFFRETLSVAAENDWQSPLVFGLATLALLNTERRRAAALWIYVGFLYAAWWFLTHRIDRFWVPLLPVACVLAGAGAIWAADLPTRLRSAELGESLRALWRGVCGLFVAVGVLFNLGFVTTPLAGNPGYLADLEAVARVVETPNLAILNRSLPAGSKVLLVGEAEIFDARFPVIYNTVFDRSIFKAWTADPRPDASAAEWPLRPASAIRETLREHGVTHVYVNWQEILRYRTTYGFTPFVTPERFEELRRLGILGTPETLREVPIDAVAQERLREAETHFPSLLRGRGPERMLIGAELYPIELSDGTAGEK